MQTQQLTCAFREAALVEVTSQGETTVLGLITWCSDFSQAALAACTSSH